MELQFSINLSKRRGSLFKLESKVEMIARCVSGLLKIHLVGRVVGLRAGNVHSYKIIFSEYFADAVVVAWLLEK